MITARDVEFHTPSDADHRHAETNWFCFYNPKEKLMGIIYTVARRGIGVQSCDVSLYVALVGNRAEIFVPSMGGSHAHFGKDMTIKWINHWDPSKPVDQQHGLAQGYVMENGQVYGLTDLELTTHRIGNVIHSVESLATDKRGKQFHAHGMAEVGGPWICHVGSLVYAAPCRWTLSSGHITL
ncbi:hypothetical protein [Hydrocarboniphaga sp.]|uniref:hypothetical protein n=1 Tax=Hydrocarboniphaga sp. TaxID=2033016 RepID=UPI003D112989